MHVFCRLGKFIAWYINLACAILFFVVIVILPLIDIFFKDMLVPSVDLSELDQNETCCLLVFFDRRDNIYEARYLYFDNSSFPSVRFLKISNKNNEKEYTRYFNGLEFIFTALVIFWGGYIFFKFIFMGLLTNK